MIKTKLIQLFYKVKNKTIKKKGKSILQKEDPHNRLCSCSKGENKNT